MSIKGVIWGLIICVPFWFIFFILIKAEIITMEIVLGGGLVAGLLFFLILPSGQNTKIVFPRYEVRYMGEHEWYKISEKKVMERMVDVFDPITPILSKMLEGEEVIISKETYRYKAVHNEKINPQISKTF